MDSALTRKLHPNLLMKQSFSFNEMQKFDYLNNRWDVFLGKDFSGFVPCV